MLRCSILPARLSTRGGQFRAPRRSSRSATPKVEGASALLELARPPRPFRVDRLREAIPDASGRLMQPTLSKTSTHAPGSQRRHSGKAGVAAEPRVSTTPGSLLPADPAAAPSVLDSARSAWGWGLTPRRRPVDAERLNASTSIRATKTASATAPLKNGGLPGPRRLPPVGHSWRARADHGVHGVHARFDHRRPFTRRVSLRASPAWSLPAATGSTHTGPTPPTDFCNRQRAWAHRSNGTYLARNPLFRRIPLSR